MDRIDDQFEDVRDPLLIGVFGTGRNGSTLLVRLLDGMPGTYVHQPEINFLAAMNDLAMRPCVRRTTIQNATAHRLSRLNRAIPARRLLRYYGQHKVELESESLPRVSGVELSSSPVERLAENERYTPQAFVPAFLDAFARWLGGGRPADAMLFKSIETPYIADYARLFPAMRFVHIIRDPVEFWSSNKRSLVHTKSFPPWYLGGDNLRTTLGMRWLPHARFLAENDGAPNHLVVRYEDLVKAPVAEVKRICDWLGREPPAEPDTQTILGGRHPRTMPANPSERGVETPRRVVDDLHESHRFADVITSRERSLIKAATWDLARRLGYFENEARPDAAEVLDAWRRYDEWDFRNVSGIVGYLHALASAAARRRFVARCCRAANA